jgi:hypothetical protein
MSFSRRTAATVVFLTIAFGIPWGTWIALRVRHASFPQGPPLAFMIGAAFCSGAGVIATSIEAGRSGIRPMARRCVL